MNATARLDWHEHVTPTLVASADQVAGFNHDGFFVMHDALHPDTVDDLLLALSAHSADEQLDASHSDVLRALCSHPLLAGLARDFLGPDAVVGHDELLVRLPHQRTAQEFAQEPDTGDAGRPTLTCWLALTNATVANGCLSIAPGLHRHGFVPEDRLSEMSTVGAVDVEVRAGSIVVLSPFTVRRSHVNASDRAALAYLVRYVGDRSAALGVDHDTVPSHREPLIVVRDGQLVGPD